MRPTTIELNIDKIVDEIITHSLDNRSNVDARKPLFAVVTGMGRGTTRLLVEIVEIDRKLNDKYRVNKISKEINKLRVISVPITFNCNWTSIIKVTNKFF